MSTTTIQFNNGAPFNVGSTEVHSASHVLPATVTALEVDLLDPNGNWVNAANAGGNFIYGIQYSPDGGTTWQIAVSNGNGQPIGSLDRQGGLPKVIVAGSTSLSHLYGNQCRAFAQLQTAPSVNVTSITIGGQAVVTT